MAPRGGPAAADLSARCARASSRSAERRWSTVCGAGGTNARSPTSTRSRTGQPTASPRPSWSRELLELADSLRDENLPIDVLDMAEPTDQEVLRERPHLRRAAAAGRARAASACASASTTTTARSRNGRAGSETGCWRSASWAGMTASSRRPGSASSSRSDDEHDEEIDEETVRRQALRRFAELDRSDLAPIRRDVREGWVARGSLHVIADRLEIGWHPRWLEHLQRPPRRGPRRPVR